MRNEATSIVWVENSLWPSRDTKELYTNKNNNKTTYEKNINPNLIHVLCLMTAPPTGMKNGKLSPRGISPHYCHFFSL